MEIKERRYSSIVRWNLSSSLRLTGTVSIDKSQRGVCQKGDKGRDVLSRKLPTSSIVRKEVLEDEFLYSVKPPSHAQSSM